MERNLDCGDTPFIGIFRQPSEDEVPTNTSYWEKYIRSVTQDESAGSQAAGWLLSVFEPQLVFTPVGQQLETKDNEVEQFCNEKARNQSSDLVKSLVSDSGQASGATDAEINEIDAYFDLAGGGRVHYDKKGRILRTEDGRGNWREFRRGADGAIREIKESNGLVLSSQDGKRFTVGSSDTEFNTIKDPKIYENGTYDFALEGGGTLRRELNGCIKVWDSNNALIEVCSDDGSRVEYDEKGNITSTTDVTGAKREFVYENGKLVQVTEANGAVYKSNNGTEWSQVDGPKQPGGEMKLGRYEILPDRVTFTTEASIFPFELNGEGQNKFESASASDHSQTVYDVDRVDGSRMRFGANRLPISVKTAQNEETRIRYDSQNQVSKVDFPDGNQWVRTGVGEWLNTKSNQRWKGTITADESGCIRMAPKEFEVSKDVVNLFALRGEKYVPTSFTRRPDGWIENAGIGGHFLTKQSANGSYLRKDFASNKITEMGDSNGVRTYIRYDERKEINEVEGADGTWNTTNGVDWTNNKNGEKKQGAYSVTPDGVIKFKSANDGSVTAQSSAGVTIKLDKVGNVECIKMANGQSRSFAYTGTPPKMVRITEPDGSEWNRKDDETWARSGSGETRKFAPSFNADGSLILRSEDGKERSVYQVSGRTLKFRDGRLEEDTRADGTKTDYKYANDKIVEVHIKTKSGEECWADGQGRLLRQNVKGFVREFGYGDDGKVTFVKHEAGELRFNADKKQWFKSGSQFGFEGTVELTPNGTIIIDDTTNVRAEVRSTDGSYRITEGDPQFTRAYDAKGRLSETIDCNHVKRVFGYDGSGRLNKISEFRSLSEQPVTWTTEDQQNWSASTGERKTFSAKLEQDTGKLSRDYGSYNLEINTPKGETIYVNLGILDGRAKAIHKYLFENGVVENVVESLERQDPIVKSMTGLCGPVSDWFKKETGIDTTGAVVKLAKESFGNKLVKVMNPDVEAVRALLKNMTKEERDLLADVYQKKYKMSLPQAFNSLPLREGDAKALTVALEQNEGEVDYAANIEAALLTRKDLLGRSSANCEKEIRDTLSRLPKEKLDKVAAEFQARTGKSMEEVLLRGELSEPTKKALAIYFKGCDKLTKEDRLSLAYIAIDAQSVDMVEEAFRGAPKEVRDQFFKDGGKEKLELAFKGSPINMFKYALGGDLVCETVKFGFESTGADRALGIKFGNFNVSETDYRNAYDYARTGRLGVGSQVLANLSWVGDNEKSIEKAFYTMSDEDRRLYMMGRALVAQKASFTETALSLVPQDQKPLLQFGLQKFPEAQRLLQSRIAFETENRMTPQQFEQRFGKVSDEERRRAVEYYLEVHSAMEKGAGMRFAPETQRVEMLRWEDMIAYKGGTLLSKLADHCGCFYHSTKNDIFRSIETISQEDWEQLKNLPENERKEVLTAIHRCIFAFKGAEVADRCYLLLNEKLGAKDYAASQKLGRRTVLDTIKDNDQIKDLSKESFSNVIDHAYGVKKGPILEAIDNMPESERQRYRTDDNYKLLLDNELDRALEPGSAARKAASDMLQRISSNTYEGMDQIDRLNLRIVQDEEQQKYTGISVSLITPTILPPAGPFAAVPGADRVVQSAGQKSGLLTNYKAAAVADLVSSFSDPKKFEEFKAKYNDTSSGFAARFDQAVAKLLTPEEIERYITPLVKGGSLPLNLQLELRRGWLQNDKKGMQSDLLAVDKKEREKLLSQPGAMNEAFKFLTPDERRVATALVRAEGKEMPEDVARSFVIGFGKSKEDVQAAWSALKPAEREDAKRRYREKYNSDVSVDLRKTMGDESEVLVCRPKTPEQAVDDVLRKYYTSYDGFGRYFVDYYWDGTGHQCRDLANQIVAMQAEHSDDIKALINNPKFRAELDEKIRQLGESLRDFKNSKEEFAEALVNGIIAAASLAAAPFSGGSSLGVIIGMALAAAALKVATKALIMGQDYNFSSTQPVWDALAGFLDGADPGAVGTALMGAFKVAKTAANVAAKAAVKEVVGGSKLLFKQLGKAELENMEKQLAKLLENPGRAIKPEEWKAIIKEAVRSEVDDVTVGKLAAQMRKNAEKGLEQEAKSLFNKVLIEFKEVIKETGNGALGGAVSGATSSMAQTDGSEGAAGVIRNTTNGAILGGTSGGAGAFAFSSSMKAGGAAYKRLRGTAKPEAKAALKPDSKPSTQPGDKPAAKPELRPDGKASAAAEPNRSNAVAPENTQGAKGEPGIRKGDLPKDFGGVDATVTADDSDSQLGTSRSDAGQSESSNSGKRSTDRADSTLPSTNGDSSGGVNDDTQSLAEGNKSALRGDKTPSRNRAFEEDTDRAIREKAKQLETANPAERKRLESEIKTLLVDQAKAICKRMGLPEDLVSADKIVLLPANHPNRGAFDAKTGLLYINPDGFNTTGCLEHEIWHFKRAVMNTSLRNADPEAFDRKVFESVARNVGNGRSRAVEVDGELVDRPREQLSQKGREALKGALELSLAVRAGKASPADQKQLQSLMKTLIDELGERRALQELRLEINHFDQVLKENLIGQDVLASNPILKDHIDKLTKGYRQRDNLTNHPEMLKYTKGLSESTTGQVDPQSYEFAPDERTSRQANDTSVIRDLARRLREEQPNLSPAERRAKLNELMGDRLTSIKKENLKQELLDRLHNVDSAFDEIERAMQRGKAKDLAKQLLALTKPSDRDAAELVNFLIERKLITDAEVPAQLRPLIARQSDLPDFAEPRKRSVKDDSDSVSKAARAKSAADAGTASHPDADLPMDEALERIELFVKKKDAKGLAEFLKHQSDPLVLSEGILDLHDLDPAQLKLLAMEKSLAGMAALEEALSKYPDEFGSVLNERIADGSVANAILRGTFDANTLCRSSLSNKELLEKIIEPFKTDPSKCGALLREIGKIKTDPSDIREVVDAICKLPPATRRKTLLLFGLDGCDAAWKKWEKGLLSDPNFDKGHAGRKAIPDEAILQFNDAIEKLGKEHVISRKEFEDYGVKRKELNELREQQNLTQSQSERLKQLEADCKSFDERFYKFEAAVQIEVNKLAQAAGLPHPIKVKFRRFEDTTAGEYTSFGNMSLRVGYMMSHNFGTPEFINTVVHELGHLEQEMTLLRLACEEAGIKPNQPISDEQVRRVSEYYALYDTRTGVVGAMGLQLRKDNSRLKDWITKTLDASKGEPLTPLERIRAERLVLSSIGAHGVESSRRLLKEKYDFVNDYATRSTASDFIDKQRAQWSNGEYKSARAELKENCGDSPSAKKLMDAYDRLYKATMKGTAAEQKTASAEFTQLALEVCGEIENKRHLLYTGQFHEQDTFPAGDYAEELVKRAVKTKRGS